MMHAPPEAFTAAVRSALPIAVALFAGGSILIHEFDDQDTRTKELFYSWLLVFFNAYIGIFIANRALRQNSSGFFVWAFLGNGMRAGAFLLLLFCFLEWEILNARGFVLKTFFGYFTFLVVLIYGLHMQTLRSSQPPKCDQKDE